MESAWLIMAGSGNKHRPVDSLLGISSRAQALEEFKCISALTRMLGLFSSFLFNYLEGTFSFVCRRSRRHGTGELAGCILRSGLACMLPSRV